MRDLRAKAGADKAEFSGDFLQARDQLGHITKKGLRDKSRKPLNHMVPKPGRPYEWGGG